MRVPVVAAFVRTMCFDCNHVSRSFGLSNPKVRCPNCGAQSVRGLFPEGTAIELMEMAEYFFLGASKRKDDLRANLTEVIAQKTEGSYDVRFLEETSKEVQAIYNQAGDLRWDQQIYNAMLERTREKLDLPSIEIAQEVRPFLFRYTADTFEEHKASAIMANSFFEKLFDDVLITLGIAFGLNLPDAETRVLKLHSFKQQSEKFEEWALISLSDAAKILNKPDFLIKHIRVARNAFIHESPFAIDAATVEIAYELIPEAVDFFAALQNAYAVRVLT